MDNQQITELINQCKHLKLRIRGFFPASLALRTVLERDKTFMIVNASNSDQPGTHWLLIAQADGQFFFADPLGQGLHIFSHVYKKFEILFKKEAKY